MNEWILIWMVGYMNEWMDGRLMDGLTNTFYFSFY